MQANCQYIVRQIPTYVDRALRAKARSENKSLNAVLVDALTRAAKPGQATVEYNDLDEFIGTWEPDPAVEAALGVQRKIENA